MKHTYSLPQIYLSIFFFTVVTFWLLSAGGNDDSPLTGNVAKTRIVVAKFIPAECKFDMEQGFNLISIPCLTLFRNTSIDSVFENLSGSFVSIHTYDPADQNDPWKVYAQGLPSWVTFDLSDIDAKQGYWINVNSSGATLVILGHLKLPSTIELSKGWNLIGYPKLNSSGINSTLSPIYPGYSVVYQYNASDTSDPWKVFYPDPPPPAVNDLNNLSPYYGYWINTTSSAQLVIQE